MSACEVFQWWPAFTPIIRSLWHTGWPLPVTNQSDGSNQERAESEVNQTADVWGSSTSHLSQFPQVSPAQLSFTVNDGLNTVQSGHLLCSGWQCFHPGPAVLHQDTVGIYLVELSTYWCLNCYNITEEGIILSVSDCKWKWLHLTNLDQLNLMEPYSVN